MLRGAGGGGIGKVRLRLLQHPPEQIATAQKGEFQQCENRIFI